MARATKAAAERARAREVSEAAADERGRFNAALRNGAVIYLHTHSGSYRVRSVSEDWWYTTDGNGGFGQSWCGANDDAWAGLLRQAGVARNPRWAHLA